MLSWSAKSAATAVAFLSVYKWKKDLKCGYYGKWSWGQISWDQNSTFSGGQIFDHEVEIQFVHEVEFVH